MKKESNRGRTKWLGAAVVGLAGVLAAGTALAANPHLVGQVQFVVQPDGTLTGTYKIAGLGNADGSASQVAFGTVELECNNGNNSPPGLTADAAASGSSPIFAADTNGAINITVTSTPDDPGLSCPPGNFTQILTFSYNLVLLEVTQDDGSTLVVTCEFDPAVTSAEPGVVPKNQVSCSD